MHCYSSTHFVRGTAYAIATLLAAQFGGSYSNYYALAIGIVGLGDMEFTGDIYEDIYYYWVPDYTDPQYPYYVKQFIVYYNDQALTNFKDTTTRYYYSSMPF